MEATAGVAATRGGSLAMSSPRKEWRAVSEHPSTRKPVDEELGRSNLGQSDERIVYEQEREPLDMHFSSMTIDGNSNNDILQQQLHGIARQREELHQMEIDLRAQMIVRSEITGMRNSFEAQVKEHADAVVRLQEQLREKEQIVHDLEKKMEDKDKEILAIKRDNEVAWAKEDLLREQKKELATFRRELDHSEAERLQHLKQIHDLQEHLQDKERQLIELQDQHGVAQAWITRVQEMDALQSHSLQAELRERTEQYNQLWLSFQRQLEMERFHLHTIQQLQLELAEVRERSGTYAGESRAPQVNSKEASHFGQKDLTQLDANGSVRKSRTLSNGNTDSYSLASNGNMGEYAAGLTLASLPAYVPPGQMTAVHPFVMPQQGAAAQSLTANVPQSQVGHYQTVQPTSAIQEWKNVQGVSESSQRSNHSQLPQTQGDQKPMSSELKYQSAANGQIPQGEYISREMEPDSVNSSSAREPKVLEPIEKNHLEASKPEQILQQISSEFRGSASLQQHQHNAESKDQSSSSFTGYEADGHGVTTDQSSPNVDRSPSVASVNNETGAKNSAVSVLSEPFISVRQINVMASTEKTPELNLLDERSLLACIVRTIPAGGRIHISSTLPNRLGKMLSPLHWHDYKRKYGKLDDFVARYPEYFVIDGDFIQLREGAQEMIAAAAAVAKVAGAAAASAPHSSVLSSVAVTPIAQSLRPKNGPADGNNIVPASLVGGHPPASQLLPAQNQHPSGLSSAAGPNVKILSKSRNPPDLNGLGLQSTSTSNGANFSSSGQGRGMTNGRPVLNSVGKPHGRISGLSSTSRR